MKVELDRLSYAGRDHALDHDHASFIVTDLFRRLGSTYLRSTRSTMHILTVTSHYGVTYRIVGNVRKSYWYHAFLEQAYRNS